MIIEVKGVNIGVWCDIREVQSGRDRGEVVSVRLSKGNDPGFYKCLGDWKLMDGILYRSNGGIVWYTQDEWKTK
jgi:hypothetical protein